MKKALLVAASLITTSVAVTTGEAVKADPQFVLTQNSAGNLQFKGIGTAQYNNSIGSNNSFQVGSSTNLGVNASTSSTPEYKVNSHAKLDLAASTTLIQVIGTSGAQESAFTETSSKLDWASEQADIAVSAWENTHGNTWSDTHSYEEDWSGPTYTSEDEWKDARKETRSNSLKENYVSSEQQASSSGQQNSTNGVISGSFTTTESGKASAGNMTSWQDDARGAADSKVFTDYDSDWNTFQAMDKEDDGTTAKNTFVDTDTQTAEEQYLHARSNAWTAAYNESFTDILSSNSRESKSDVVVTGIGSDAEVTSRDTSTFDVDIQTTLANASEAESTATATGAAGANLSTSSFANQSMASTASAFMQAFGGSQVGFVETDTTMGTNTGTGNVGVDDTQQNGLNAANMSNPAASATADTSGNTQAGADTSGGTASAGVTDGVPTATVDLSS